MPLNLSKVPRPVTQVNTQRVCVRVCAADHFVARELCFALKISDTSPSPSRLIAIYFGLFARLDLFSLTTTPARRARSRSSEGRGGFFPSQKGYEARARRSRERHGPAAPVPSALEGREGTRKRRRLSKWPIALARREISAASPPPLPRGAKGKKRSKKMN